VCVWGGGAGPVWTVAENLTPAGIQSPNRPASSELLYRLRYTHPSSVSVNYLKIVTTYNDLNATEYDPSTEADSSSASRATPAFYGTPMFTIRF
jgi:hypothetical protein